MPWCAVRWVRLGGVFNRTTNEPALLLHRAKKTTRRAAHVLFVLTPRGAFSFLLCLFLSALLASAGARSSRGRASSSRPARRALLLARQLDEAEAGEPEQRVRVLRLAWRRDGSAARDDRATHPLRVTAGGGARPRAAATRRARHPRAACPTRRASRSGGGGARRARPRSRASCRAGGRRSRQL